MGIPIEEMIHQANLQLTSSVDGLVLLEGIDQTIIQMGAIAKETAQDAGELMLHRLAIAMHGNEVSVAIIEGETSTNAARCQDMDSNTTNATEIHRGYWRWTGSRGCGQAQGWLNLSTWRIEKQLDQAITLGRQY